MTILQKTLFDELDEVSKKPFQVARPLDRPIILTRDDLVSSDDGIIFPCVTARRLSIDDRPEHMKNCDICKRLEKELDEKVGYKGNGVWYE